MLSVPLGEDLGSRNYYSVAEGIYWRLHDFHCCRRGGRVVKAEVLINLELSIYGEPTRSALRQAAGIAFSACIIQ